MGDGREVVQEGVIVAVDDGVLVMKVGDQAVWGHLLPLAVQVASIRELEFSLGKRTQAGKGARIGLLLGAGVGMAAGAALSGEPPIPRRIPSPPTRRRAV